MSTQHHVNHPKSMGTAGAGPRRPAQRVRPSQRDLVLASLVRCPEHRSSTAARKGA